MAPPIKYFLQAFLNPKFSRKTTQCVRIIKLGHCMRIPLSKITTIYMETCDISNTGYS